MLFSYAVRAVYIESCSLFVRGGVYRVVKAAIGGMPAKAAVSALLFDYVLTGPISSVSAGQYLVGWLLELLTHVDPSLALSDEARAAVKHYGAVLIAVAITLYFFRKNLIGIHESSGKALRIMGFTTVVAAVVLIWCGVTLAVRGPVNKVPIVPDLSPKYELAVDPDGIDRLTGEKREVWVRDENGNLLPKLDADGRPIPKINPLTHHQEDPLGFLPAVFPGPPGGVRAFNSGNERRRDDGAGLSRSRVAQAAQLQESGVCHLHIQPHHDGGDLVSCGTADSRRSPHERLRRQPAGRPGDARAWPGVAADWTECRRRRRRLFDSLGRGQHLDHRIQWRPQPGG
jgi:hypothetical protein